MVEADDVELVRRARQGDGPAFEMLVERYKDRVFGLIVRTIADRQRADDLAQEVFLRVYRGLPYFRGEARFSTWLYRIVANLCHQPHGPGGVREIPLDARDDDSGRPKLELGSRDAAFGDLELRDRLQKALATLPANYRLLIAGHYLEGISYEDLAETLNVPLGTVKTHLHRAKQQLRRVLQAELG
jgi:RNA polymerase sigma-70 factor (ECF subfamily)